MKLIIAGTRTFSNYTLLKQECDRLTANVTITEVISGGNRRYQLNDDGTVVVLPTADLLGELWAIENNIPVTIIPANWNKYAKKAGPIRNGQMAERGDGLIAFWDGASRGTKSMVELARLGGLKVKIVRYE